MSYKLLDNLPKKIKLGEIAEYITTRTPIENCHRNTYISTTNMLPNKKGITEIKAIPKTKTVNSFEKNDILISNIRPYFKKIWIAEFDGTNSSDVLVIRGNETVLPKFLYYALSNDLFFDYATKSAKGTKMPRGDKQSILNYQIPKLTLKEQEKISNILSALDDKIELNNKINKNLEEQAQLLFKHWFVDFEFPNEEGLPYKSCGGEMFDSALGMIPKGWEVRKLKEISEIKYGKNLPVKSLLDKGYPVFGGNGIIGYYNEYMYEHPEVLIACRGAASGKMNISLPKSFITNNSLVLESKNRVYYEYLKGRFAFKNLESYATGSAQPQITITNIKEINILIPNDKFLKLFFDYSNKISQKKLNYRQQNQRLSEIRDTLLPKLMSGEVRIPLD